MNAEVDLDLNHDGITDFFLFLRNSTTGDFETLLISGIKSRHQIWGSGRWASALRPGVPIGFKGKFPGGNAMATWMLDSGKTFSGGPWKNVQSRYLGFKFVIQGKVYFGWARLNVTMTWIGIKAALTGYAYETIPNKPIIAGNIVAGKTEEADEISVEQPNAVLLIRPVSEPATLGLLAMGAPGLSIWRRESPGSLS